MRTTHFYCSDCKTRFIVCTGKAGRRFCPLCGDCISVSKYDQVKVEANKRPVRTSWTIEEVDKLFLLRATTKMYQKEIAQEIGRSYKATARMIQKLKI